MIPSRELATLVAMVLAALLAVAAPIGLSIQQARKQGYEAEAARALGYARDVLHRSDLAAAQVHDSIRKLAEAGGKDPCSEANIDLMRRTDLATSYVQMIGAVSGDSFTCSSLGRHPGGLPIGAPTLVTSTGSAVRTDVEFPFAKGVSFIVIERQGYAAVIHKDLPVDVSTLENDVSLATFTPDDRQIRSSRGKIRTEWLAPRPGREATFVDGDYIVAVASSPRFATAAIAALPIAYQQERTRELTAVLVPVGITAGLLLAFAVLHLAKLQQSLPAALRSALRRDELYNVYQPIVDLRTGKVVGAEALLRWSRGVEHVRPDLFIPAAEEAGLITRITERVVENAERDAPGLFSRHPDFHIAVNLSAADLTSERTVGLFRELARVTDAAPGNLVAEMTERGFIDVAAVENAIAGLRAAGVRLAIDDFGTGYSSLASLQSLPLDLLKIDKSFVDTIGTEASTSQVVAHIIEMARTLGLEMVAEGVETHEQARYLRERGVQYAQGFLYGKPMPLRDVLNYQLK